MISVLSQVSSFETFCGIDGEEFVSLPSNSTWDYNGWRDALCAFNETEAMAEFVHVIQKFSLIVRY